VCMVPSSAAAIWASHAYRTFPSQKESKEKTRREIARHHEPHQHEARRNGERRNPSTLSLPTYRYVHGVLELRLSGSSVSRFVAARPAFGWHIPFVLLSLANQDKFDKTQPAMKHFIQASATVFINPLGPDFETLHGQVEACSVPAAISRDENYVKKVVECGGLRPLAVL
jgi:hypothetical protein